MEKWHKATQISNKIQKIAENIEFRAQLSPYRQFKKADLVSQGIELFGIDQKSPEKVDYSGFLNYARKFVYESSNTVSGMYQKKLISESDKDRLLSDLVILNREVTQLKNLTKTIRN
ncbi:MAG: hypothetical protein JW731_10620 [Bacteroidales bacterium]|nr:hypothetical protein [Bacteroidales bacterium]